MMVTTPNVVRLTADVVLLIGAGLLDAWPELPERLLAPLASSPAEEGLVRRIIRLCPGRDPARSPALEQAQMIGRGADGLPVLLAALRARVAGRQWARPGSRQGARHTRRGSARRALRRCSLVGGGTRRAHH